MEQNPPSPTSPETPASTELAITPRAVTPKIRRRLWLEPGVRRWWLLGILILLMFGAYAGDCLWNRHRESDLIQNGITLVAKIVAADNKVGRMPLSPVDTVKIEIPFPEQSETQVGHLSSNNYLQGNVTVHIDPADHAHWTDRSTPTPLLDSLLLALLGLPIVPIMLALAYVQSRAMQQTWKNGSASPAVIFERDHSAIAPMSYRLKCHLINSRQKQLFTVYVPQARTGLEKGDQIWVIAPQKKGRYLAALWMATA
jgi:hypothetical protein